MSTRKSDTLFTQQLNNDLDCFFEPIHTLFGIEELDAVCTVLVHLPAGSETENESTTTHTVKSCRTIGEYGRVMNSGGCNE